MSTIEQEQYHDNVSCEFAELMYQQMASVRYGIDFCYQADNDKWLIKKELLDLNAIKVDGLCDDVT